MTVLTDDERHFLVEGLAGPHGELPDLRAPSCSSSGRPSTPGGSRWRTADAPGATAS